MLFSWFRLGWAGLGWAGAQVDIPAGLRAEHVLLLEANASLVRRLTWNGAARIPEAVRTAHIFCAMLY